MAFADEQLATQMFLEQPKVNLHLDRNNTFHDYVNICHRVLTAQSHSRTSLAACTSLCKPHHCTSTQALVDGWSQQGAESESSHSLDVNLDFVRLCRYFLSTVHKVFQSRWQQSSLTTTSEHRTS
ncbi:hypothetical protein EGW08_009481 [Elysia chlorotica]|uniref:Uncharacterized protein n=1 Tax=Elysia chlorotica TaxID=188477 RepID=A0A433TMD2_ELYCH|nr:hypothetical protein EGW08_009481 [Elysia chlorotica]